VLRNDFNGKVSWLDLDGGNDHMTGTSLKPSVLYFADRFRLGAYVRLPMTFAVEQHNYQELYSANDGYFFDIHERLDPSLKETYSDTSDCWRASYKIKTPAEIGLGLSLGTPGVQCIAADMVLQNWKDAKIVDDLDPDPYYFHDKYRNTLNWGVGVEHTLPLIHMVIRAGYRSEPLNFSGPRGETGPAVVATKDRRFVTVGMSSDMDQLFQFDIGFAHGIWTQQEGNRKDSQTANQVNASITYHIPVVGGLTNRR
jgi:long-subunit fatty acid transport protein